MSHPAGSEQGDEVKGQGVPRSTVSASWPCFRPGACLLAACVHFSLAGGSVSKAHQQGRSICSPTAIKNISIFFRGSRELLGQRRTQRRPDAQVTHWPLRCCQLRWGAGVAVGNHHVKAAPSGEASGMTAVPCPLCPSMNLWSDMAF